MSLSVKQLLENRGVKPKEEHVEVLGNRWKGLLALRGDLEDASIDDAAISLRNTPGGDHVE